MEKRLARRQAGDRSLNSLSSMNLFSISETLAISAVGRSAALANLASSQSSQRLADGWEYLQGPLGSTWEIWRGDAATDNVTRKPVTLPHRFYGRDAGDPEFRYYQGPGWYRKQIKVANPFPIGRNLLHFGGAGQRSGVFVGTDKVGGHFGGYDESSESDRVNLFDLHLKEMEQTPNLTGVARWSFKEFSTPLRPENPVPCVNPKGVIERDGSPKEIYDGYQICEWGKPVRVESEESNRTQYVSTVEARVSDQAGVPCLDAADIVRFNLTGDGQPPDNLGTADGSRVVQLGSGRARISIQINGPSIVASAASKVIETKIPTFIP